MPTVKESVNEYLANNPTNHRIQYTMTANNRAMVHGSGGGNTSISISTTYRTMSYTIAVEYMGPVALQNRVIVEKTVPNYWKNEKINAKARAEANVECCTPEWDEAYQGMGFKEYACLCLSTWIPCLIYVCIQKPRYDRYKAVSNRMAREAMSGDIIAAIKTADDMIDERVRYLEGRSGSASEGQRQAATAFPSQGFQHSVFSETKNGRLAVGDLVGGAESDFKQPLLQ